MPIELTILVHDEATEEEIKEIARAAISSPVVVGVYRHPVEMCPEDGVVHAAPSRLQ